MMGPMPAIVWGYDGQNSSFSPPPPFFRFKLTFFIIIIVIVVLNIGSYRVNKTDSEYDEDINDRVATIQRQVYNTSLHQ